MEGGNAARRNHKLAFVIDGGGSGRSFAGRYLASISRRVIAVSRVTPKPLVTRFDVSSSAFVPPFFRRLSYFFFLNSFSIEIHRSDPITSDHFSASRFRTTSVRTRDFFSFLNTVYDVADCLTDSPVTSNAVHGSSKRFLLGRETRFPQTPTTICELSSDRSSFYLVGILFRAKASLSSALRLATPKASYGVTRVRTNKVREIEPNPGEFLLSTLRDDEASDRVRHYLSSGRRLPLDRPLSLVFVLADSLSRAFSLAERPSRSTWNQRGDVRSDSVSHSSQESRSAR